MIDHVETTLRDGIVMPKFNNIAVTQRQLDILRKMERGYFIVQAFRFPILTKSYTTTQDTLTSGDEMLADSTVRSLVDKGLIEGGLLDKGRVFGYVLPGDPRLSCEIPVLGIIDVDGSLVRYVYGDEELLTDQDRLDRVLADLKPFPWVIETGILSKMTVRKVITGRKPRHRDLTIEWFAREFGLRDIDITLVPFYSKMQYLSDKMREIRSAIDGWVSMHGVGARIIIIEDDPEILRLLRDEFTGPNIQIVAVDKNGIPHFS